MKTRMTLILCMAAILLQAQSEKQYRIRTIAFYNVENLFDIKNDTLTFDDDRTPTGKDQWTIKRYQQKIDNISKVLAEIGAGRTHTPPDIIGLCEIENRTVLEDLIAHSLLHKEGYGIIHFDSPDERGIDVALLYKKEAFLPISFASHRLLLFDEGDQRNYTRDQLAVGGMLDDEQFYFMVNHWPSRRGGAIRSKPNRMAAAKLNRHIIDSIQRLDPSAKIISMGDLNDDPIDDSLKKVLKTKGKRNKLEADDLFNPMEKLYKQGIGSLAYRDQWNLFDQMFFTSTLVNNEKDSYTFWKAEVFNAPYLVTKKGQYKGYPFRTYAGGSYTGGYSDHFPVYIHLIKEVKKRNTPMDDSMGPSGQ